MSTNLQSIYSQGGSHIEGLRLVYDHGQAARYVVPEIPEEYRWSKGDLRHDCGAYPDMDIPIVLLREQALTYIPDIPL